MQGKRTNVTKVMLEKLFKHGLSPIILALSLAIGLIAVNYVVAVKAPSYDVTKNKTNTLSKQTKKLLDEINYDVTIKAFYATESKQTIQKILEMYTKLNSHIKVEFIDPLRKPLIADEYEVKYPRTIILETAKSKTRINPPTNPGQRHGEREITIAIYRLTTEQSKTIYFSTGHGEMSITNTKFNGLSTIKTRLDEQNYIINTVNLLEAGKVPEDCTLLIVAGPDTPFLEEEATMIRDYLDHEGTIFLMINPGVELKLEKLIASYGLQYGNDYIYETSRNMTTTNGGPFRPLCEAMDEIEITAPLENQTFMFPLVRSVSEIFRPAGIAHIKLVGSSENSWAETDLESLRRMEVGQKPVRNENEKKGPLPVGMLTEREFMLPDSIATSDNSTVKVRSAFWGNSHFISNEVVAAFSANLNLFLNTVNWITRNEKIIEVTPHSDQFTWVELRDSERRFLTWLTLVIFPSSLLFIGIVIWYRRR